MHWREFDAEQAVPRFAEDLRAKGKEESTVKMYVWEVRHFADWLQTRGKPLSAVTQVDVLEASAALHSRGTKFATMNKSISTLSSFFKWANAEGYVGHNPAERIRLLSPKKSEPPRWLNEDESGRLLALAAKERSSFKRARNMALIAAMLYAGLRVDEVSQLREDSLRETQLIVYEGQHIVRKVPLSTEALTLFRAWAVERQHAGKPQYEDSPYFFITARAPRMQPRAIQFVVESYSDKLGLPIVCQHLRHTYCRRQALYGTPVHELKEMAGHKSLLTTCRYYEGLE
jgi:integrase/recombinase XerC